VPVLDGKKVWVDEGVLDDLKNILGFDSDTEAIHVAARRIIEIEETLMLFAERDRLQQLSEGWRQDPDAWKGGD
jgi:hypothetical protein